MVDKLTTEIMDRRGMLWLNEEIEQLKHEWNAGDSLEKMVLAHGRTPYAIIGKLQSLGWIVHRGYTSWHRVDPDPWVLDVSVSAMQRLK
jgi:hypothetical protein